MTALIIILSIFILIAFATLALHSVAEDGENMQRQIEEENHYEKLRDRY